MNDPALIELDPTLLELDRVRAEYRTYRAEAEPWRAIADAARYLMQQGGYAGCLEDGECEEQQGGDGANPCPHVTTHYATATDRLMSDRLIHLVEGLWETVRARPGVDPKPDVIGDVVDLLHSAAAACLAVIDDVDPRGDVVERPQVLIDIDEAADVELTARGEGS